MRFEKKEPKVVPVRIIDTQTTEHTLGEEVKTELSLLSESVSFLLKELERERTRNSKLQTVLDILNKEKANKEVLIQSQKNTIKEFDSKIKYLEKNQLLLQEKIKINKEITNIVKNNKNTDQISKLNKRLDEYIEYIEDTIKLLRTL